MKRLREYVLSRANVFSLFPGEFRSVFQLLDNLARTKFLYLSLLQILLASLEVIALSVLAVTVTFSLNAYTIISKQDEGGLGALNYLLADLDTELQIAALLAIYVVLTVTKTFLSAIITLSTLNLLAKQSTLISHRLNTALFERGIEVIRFGKSQENLAGVTYSLDSLLIGYLGTFNQLVGDVATIFMICGALLFVDFETSLILILLFLSLVILLHRFVNVVASNLGEKIAKLTAKLNRKILDGWLVYREMLLAQKVDGFLTSTFGTRAEIAKSRARLNFLPSLSKYIFELFLIISALVVSGIQLWISGISDAVRSFILMAAASTRLLPAFMRLQSNILTINQSIGSGTYARTTIDKIEQITSAKTPAGLNGIFRNNFKAEMIVRALDFTYPDSTKTTLKNVTFSVTPGTITAIVGSSGSGKSTLVDLILGFLTPTSGMVLINGFDPRIARRVWPEKIAYVPQEVQIFEGSIAENVVLGFGNDYKESDLLRCLELSGLIEDIRNLNDGLETQVGERGLKLSGGQRQRLGIARALYVNPELLIFDEATSSLDTITENRITRNIFHKSTGRTVIVIAHRLSTVMHADKIIYLKDGNLVASGTFNELKELVPEFLEQAELSGL